MGGSTEVGFSVGWLVGDMEDDIGSLVVGMIEGVEVGSLGGFGDSSISWIGGRAGRWRRRLVLPKEPVFLSVVDRSLVWLKVGWMTGANTNWAIA